tara:strand:- start:1895 stop:2767 length:873 start_codon:yes stop_codon:yes gene_type:complete
MGELDDFMKSEGVVSKSANTQKAYNLQYRTLEKLLGKPVGEASQDKLIKTIKEHENNNGKSALVNIAILVRRFHKNSTKELEDYREKLKENIKTDTRKKNVDLPKSLPSYEDIVEYTDMLYEQNEWTDYIINYLLLHYNVRNKDLLFDIIRRKKVAKDDPKKNYLWLSDNFVEYIRNDYKTRDWNKTKPTDAYGPKIYKIKDKKFMTAVRRVFACQKHNEDCGVFIPNEAQLGYYLKKATLGGIGETAYNKVIINHFRKDIDKLKEISQSRGTSIGALLEYYDIQNIMKD